MPETSDKKKLPLWLKLTIAAFAVFALLGFAVGVGTTILGGLFNTGGGDKLVEKGMESWIEAQMGAEGKNVDVDLKEDGFVIKDKESGEMLAIKSGQELPAGFPEEIPIPKNSQIMGSMTMRGMKSVTLETNGSPQEFATFYREQMKNKGWDELMASQQGSDNFSAVFRKDRQQLTVGISADEDQSTISLTYVENPQK